MTSEVRLTRAAHEILDDMERDTVEFQANYDESSREPIVLPAKFPNLLVNGAGGIAVGMATNIPPHNLGEVVDATLALIEKPDMSIEDLIEYVPAPDFPTGGVVLGRGVVDGVDRHRRAWGGSASGCRLVIYHRKRSKRLCSGPGMAVVVSDLEWALWRVRIGVLEPR